MEPPVFVVGPGRSGTTLVQSLLDEHPDFAVPPETHFLHVAAELEDATGRPPTGAELWDAYRVHPRFGDLGLTPAACEARIPADAAPRDVFLAILAAYAAARGKPRVGEKTPGHWRRLDRIFEWFPQARVVVLQRDPRASGASQLRTPWVARSLSPVSLRRGIFLGKRWTRILGDARAWARIHDQIVPRHRDDPRVMVLSYEALTDRPEETVDTLFDFLGAARADVLTARRDTTVEAHEQTYGAWRGEHLAKARGAITPASRDKWRSELSAGETALIEAVCAAPMARLGYATVSPGGRLRRGALRARLLSQALAAERRLRGLAGA